MRPLIGSAESASGPPSMQRIRLVRNANRQLGNFLRVAEDQLCAVNPQGGLGHAVAPTESVCIGLAKIQSAVKHAGRQRSIDARAQGVA